MQSLATYSYRKLIRIISMTLKSNKYVQYMNLACLLAYEIFECLTNPLYM